MFYCFKSICEPDEHQSIIAGQATYHVHPDGSLRYLCLEVTKSVKTGKQNLNNSYEEASQRILIHVLDALQSGCTKVVLLSNDTDVIYPLLYVSSF